MTSQMRSLSERHAFDRSQKISIIKKAFLNVYETRLHKNELIIFCPKHHHHKPKLEINIENDIFNCWVCGYRGGVPKLLRETFKFDLMTEYMSLMGLGYDDSENQSEGILEPPRGVYGANLSEAQIGTISKKTGLSKNSIIKGAIGLSEDEKYIDRIIFPSFDVNGNFNYFTTRSLVDDKKYKYVSCHKSAKSIVFNELFIDWNKPIILVESSKTHYKMIDYGNFIPILGSILHKNSKLVFDMVANDVSEAVLMFDRDANDKQINAAQTLLNLGLNVKLVNELKGENQPDALCEDDILECIENATCLHDSKSLLKMKIANKL